MGCIIKKIDIQYMVFIKSGKIEKNNKIDDKKW